MRAWLDEHYTGRVFLAEACQLPSDVRQYFGDGDGDEFHMGYMIIRTIDFLQQIEAWMVFRFHFPVMPRIYLSIRSEECTTLRDILADTPSIPQNCQWVTFLRNHDELTLEMVCGLIFWCVRCVAGALSHSNQVTPEERKWMWEQYAPEPRMKINLGIRRRLAPLVKHLLRRCGQVLFLIYLLLCAVEQRQTADRASIQLAFHPPWLAHSLLW